MPDQDYEKFKTLCNYILKKIKMPEDERYQKVNSKKSLRRYPKRPPTVRMSTRRGKCIIKVEPYRGVPSSDEMISYLRSHHKMIVDSSWLVTYTNEVETSREIGFKGVVGDEGWVKRHNQRDRIQKQRRNIHNKLKNTPSQRKGQKEI